MHEVPLGKADRRKATVSPLPAMAQPVKLDWLADFVIPACVFGLLGSLLYFLIDLRQYLAGGEAAILRYVVFWFLIGVVGLSRMAARPGSSTVSPEAYSVVLGGAVVLVVLQISGWEGAFVYEGQQSRPWLALVLNLMTVAGIWVAAWVLTGLCTRLEHALEEMRSGGLASVSGYAKTSGTPARAILVVTGLAIALFGYGLAIVHAGHPLRRHAYLCAGLFLLFAMLLMALVNLGATRVAAQASALRIRGRVVSGWVAGAGVLAMIVVILAAALPGAESRLSPRAPNEGSSQMDQNRDRWGRGARRGSSDEPDQGPGGRRTARGGVQPERGEVERPEGAMDKAARAMANAIESLRRAAEGSLRWLIWALLAGILLAVAWWQRRRIVALVEAIGALLARLLAAIGKLLGGRQRPEGAQAQLPRDPWADIFTGGDPSLLDPAMAVRHLWRAMEMFYAAAGASRRENETELEFARRAPDRLGITRQNVRRVADLYSACEYGQRRPPRAVVPEMAEVWRSIVAAAQAARAAQRA
jgi:uncharacterized membrane protein